MIQQNPFHKGFSKPTIEPLFCVISDDSSIVQYLPIHPSQQSIELHLLEDSSGRYCDSYVFAYLENIGIPDDVLDECDRLGYISHILFQVQVSDDEQITNLGYYFNEDDAQRAVDNYYSISNAHSRCWRISSYHITVEAMFNLVSNAQRLHPDDYGSTGIELIPKKDNALTGQYWGMVVILNNVPWSEKKCSYYQTEMEKWQFDAQFIAIILTAGRAGVGILIFDEKAEILAGLPVSKVYLRHKQTNQVDIDHYWLSLFKLWDNRNTGYTPLDQFKILMEPATEEEYLSQQTAK